MAYHRTDKEVDEKNDHSGETADKKAEENEKKDVKEKKDDDDDDDDDDVELYVLGCWWNTLGTHCDQCMVQCCFTSTETVRFIRTESPGRPPRLSHSS